MGISASMYERLSHAQAATNDLQDTAPRDIKSEVQSIGSAYEAEQLTQQKATVYGGVPLSYELITAEWLTAALKCHVKYAHVMSFKLGPVDVGTSNRRRITLEWNDVGCAAGLPTSVFCKATQDSRLAFGGAKSEVNFYSINSNLCGVIIQIRIECPHAYFAAFDYYSCNSIIIMQDLSKVATFFNSKTVVTRPIVEQQLRSLAKIHGEFYDSRECYTKDFPTFYEGFICWTQSCNVTGACAKGVTMSRSVIPPRVFDRRNEIWPATIFSCNWDDKLKKTIIHGDVHLGNWYQRDNGIIGLHDYQRIARGHWSRDIAYLLATALTVEDRRQWQQDLMQFYLSALASSGGPQVGIEEAWTYVRLQLFTVLAYWTATVRPSEDMPLAIHLLEASFTYIGRITAMIDDLGSLDVVKPLLDSQ